MSKSKQLLFYIISLVIAIVSFNLLAFLSSTIFVVPISTCFVFMISTFLFKLHKSKIPFSIFSVLSISLCLLFCYAQFSLQEAWEKGFDKTWNSGSLTYRQNVYYDESKRMYDDWYVNNQLVSRIIFDVNGELLKKAQNYTNASGNIIENTSPPPQHVFNPKYFVKNVEQTLVHDR